MEESRHLFDDMMATYHLSAEETHVHCVGPGASEGPNTQDQAGRLMAETVHHLKDMIPPLIHLTLLTILLQQRNMFA